MDWVKVGLRDIGVGRSLFDVVEMDSNRHITGLF